MQNLKKNLPKLIFLALGIIIAIEVISVFRALREAPPPPLKSQARPIGDARLIVASNKSQYKVGENVLAQVRVDTGGHATSGTDVLLKYDPTLFEASAGAVRAGKIYSEYPVADVDSKSGTIRVSGIAAVKSKGFNGVGVLANISLKTKKAGTAKINFDFKPGSTADSNVIDLKTAQDLLGKVTDLEVTIK